MAKVTIHKQDGTVTEVTSTDPEEIRQAEDRAFTDPEVTRTQVTDITPDDRR
ncbi:hypothetical protein [Nocardiopsis halophila]|uniref:hypothetical protein n=1 Tax=Nocardiopsis halophila TaxID=141692 RepID=UPI0003483B9F|nr:hypothetical protein [Nocardiopsis halophila]